MRGERGVNNENVKLFTVLMFLFFAVSGRSTMRKRRTTMAAKDWMMGWWEGDSEFIIVVLIAGNVQSVYSTMVCDNYNISDWIVVSCKSNDECN